MSSRKLPEEVASAFRACRTHFLAAAALCMAINLLYLALPIYTSLFTKLGWAGVACTAVAIVVIWPMKRLSRAHAAHVSDDPSGVPTVAAER